MILNQFDSSFVDTFDENPLSQIGAGDYVQSVMATNKLITAVSENGECKKTVSTTADIHNADTSALTNTPRKRRCSDSQEISENKKMKSAHPPTDTTPNHNDSSSFNILASMIAKLAENVNSLGCKLEKRISDIEGNVEKRLTVKFNTVISDRVKNEVDKLKEEIDSEVNVVRDKVENLEKSYAEIVASNNGPVQTANKSNENLNVIVKNLPVDQRENTNSG